MIQSPQLERSSPTADTSSDAIPKVRQSRLLDKSKTPWFFGLLAGCKILSALSTFLLFDFLQVNHELVRVAHRSPPTGVIFGSWSTYIQTLSVIQILSGVIFIICQKRFSPWNKSPTFTRRDWLKVFRHATLLSILLLLWVSGLRLSGPFQTVIITSHYNFTLAGIFTGFFIAKSGVKLRGGVLFVGGILVLLLFGNNNVAREETSQIPAVGPTKSVSSVSQQESDSVQALSTNSVSILVLVGCLVFKMIFEALSKNLAADFGGSRRLHALSTSISGLILLTLYMIDLMSGADMIPFWSNVTTLMIITLFGFVLEYYVDNICLKRLEPIKVARVGTTASMGAALLYALLRTSDEIPNTAMILAFCLIYLGILSLTSQEKASGGGSFVGYSSDGLPLFNFSNHFLSDTYVPSWKNILRSISSLLKQIQEDAISRKMFYYALLTLIYTGFKFVYGVFTHRLGMITDSFHMMFDTLALYIGLSASVICRWKPSKTFPFGYGRIEILSGFLNSVFLLVIAASLIVTSCQRLYTLTLVDVQRLLPVSFIELIVKLLGIYIFKSNVGGGHGHLNNANVKGVFIHILADTMSSLGGICSTFLISNYEIRIADPVISLIVAVLIITSVVPLLTDTAKTLLLSVPDGLEKNLQQAVLQILTTEGVKGYRNPRFWTHAPNLLTGSIHVQATQDANEQHVIRQVNNLFNSMGFTHFTTQLEKDEFIARKSFADDYDTTQEASLDSCLVHGDRVGMEGFGSEAVSGEKSQTIPQNL